MAENRFMNLRVSKQPSSANRFIRIHSRSDSLANSSVVQQQKIIIQNKYGEKLVGILHDTGSSQIVALCHGARSSKEEPSLVSIASALEKEGISAFRFDFSGNGESEGTYQSADFSKEADDLHSVIEHFNKVNRVITAIAGHSKGAITVLLYASMFRDVRIVVSISARYNVELPLEALGVDYMQRLKEYGHIEIKTKTGVYRMIEAKLMEVLNVSMRDVCLKISKDCRVQIVHGSADEFSSVENAYQFQKVIPNNILSIVEGADHRYTKHQKELASVVSNFIKTTIDEDKRTPIHVARRRHPRCTL